jgi:hypothetical protein
MIFLCRDSPLVTDVSTYWYSYQGYRTDSLSAQCDGSDCSRDSGLAYSWQNVKIAGGGSASRWMVMKFGPESHANVSLSMVFDDSPSPFPSGGKVSIWCTLTSSISNDMFRTFRDVNGRDLPLVTFTNVSIASSSFQFYPSKFLNSTGFHELLFYAANLYGDVSRAVPWTLSYSSPLGSTPRSPTQTPHSVSFLRFWLIFQVLGLGLKVMSYQQVCLLAPHSNMTYPCNSVQGR